MIRNHKAFIATLATIGFTALPLIAGSSAAFASDITYGGIDFDYQGSGTAAVSGTELLLKPTGNSFKLHTNRIPDNGNGTSPINANGTPYIRFSYYDTGIDGQRITGNINDETAGVYFGAGSRDTFAKQSKLTLGTPFNEEYLLQEGNRTNVLHNVTLGKTADNTVYTIFDGVQYSSDFFKTSGNPFDFNDFYLQANGADGETIRFTNLEYGNDFSPLAQAVPEPSNLLLLGLGLGMVGMLIRRRRTLS